MKRIKPYDVLGVGVAAVDDLLYVCSYPPQNVKVAINSIERQGGGPACTAMAAVGTLYGRAAYAGRLGTDDLSLYIEESLKHRRVDTSHIVREARAAPYHSFIVVDQDGSRNVFYDQSKYMPLMEEDLSAALIQSAELVLLDHVADPALVEVARKVHDLKVPIVADVEGRSEPARRLASMADHLIVPEEFALWASGSQDVRSACAYLAQTRRLSTIVTCGSRGCYYSVGPDRLVTHFPAFSVESFDTTGCGDTFHGAFALAVARNFSLFEAVAFASAAAALKAFAGRGTRKGWNALPTLDEIIFFLRSSRPDCESELLDKIYHLRPDQVT